MNGVYPTWGPLPHAPRRVHDDGHDEGTTQTRLESLHYSAPMNHQAWCPWHSLTMLPTRIGEGTAGGGSNSFGDDDALSRIEYIECMMTLTNPLGGFWVLAGPPSRWSILPTECARIPSRRPSDTSGLPCLSLCFVYLETLFPTG